MVVETSSVNETIALGRLLGAAARPGDVFALVGPLGAGKTQLVKGIAAGLGVHDDHAVCSPTFVLINEYTGRCTLYHLDAYRLRGPRDLAALGFEELCASGGVVVVEWADRVPQLVPPDATWITIEPRGESLRSLTIAAPVLAAGRFAAAVHGADA